MVYFLYLIFISLSLDSLFKIPLGDFNVHISHILLIAFFALYSQRLTYLSSFVRDNKFLFMLFCIITIDFIRALELGVFFKVYIYFVVALLLFYFIYSVIDKVANFHFATLSILSLYLVLFGGFVQYILLYQGDTQLLLAGIQEGYYENGGSIGERLRGFFLEPNWFGLSLYFSFLACFLFYRMGEYTRASFIITAFLSFSALYLSGNRLIMFLLILLICGNFIGSVIKSKKNIYRLVFILFTSILVIYLYLILSGNEYILQDRSISARSNTLVSSFLYLTNIGELKELIFGMGFSNWGTLSNQALLSSYNYLGEQGLAQRDTAELQVFLLENGLLSLFLILLDAYFISKSAATNCVMRETAYISIFGVCSLIFIGVFYPIYTFMMYLPFYFIIRTIALKGEGYDKRY